ncbi:hypothetical protein BH11MYX3_BH11MYX3_19030 [soil metagenome]
MKILLLAMGALGIGMGACSTRSNPNYCSTDTDCDAATPFCDVAGEFDESNHEAHNCTVRPAGCSIERCGCTVGAGLTCDLDQLTSCNADGHSTSVQTCSLGCSTEPRCLAFEPSNGLGPALADSANKLDVTFPAGTVIDTDLGTATNAGTTISVSSILVPQPGAKPIRAFLARSLVIDGLTVRGENPLALVATGSILVRGKISARGTGSIAGPGAQDVPAVCVGQGYQDNESVGTGGGGNATTGGKGGGEAAFVKQGGVGIPSFTPLVGGCRGGTISGTSPAANGGAGGGAMQLVATGTVTLSNVGLIDLGGGGGDDRAGGGSGGNLVIEAPAVHLEGAAAGISANGGSGGGCSARGSDGPTSMAAAPGPKCSHSFSDAGSASAGNGGTATVVPEGAETWTCPQGIVCFASGAGGGGGEGNPPPSPPKGAEQPKRGEKTQAPVVP